MEVSVLQMRMSKEVIELIKQNYKSMTPKELNALFAIKNLRVFKESTLKSKIDLLLLKDSEREKKRLSYEKRALENPIKHRATTLLAGARQRAKMKGIPCNLTLKWIEDKLIQGCCECTGISFFIKPYSKRECYIPIHPHAPSLDQINPSKGYTFDNVQIVCDQFNKMKNDRSMKQTYYVARQFVKYQRELRKNKTIAIVETIEQ